MLRGKEVDLKAKGSEKNLNHPTHFQTSQDGPWDPALIIHRSMMPSKAQRVAKGMAGYAIMHSDPKPMYVRFIC